LPTKSVSTELEFPASLADLSKNAPEIPLYPSYESSLDLSIDPFLEKSCDLLLEAVESHYTELNNFQYFQRQLAREQTKVTAWQTKRKAENAGRVAAGQTPLSEEEWKTLFQLPQEPSRLESMLIARQVEQYGRNVDNFTATISSKMFLSKETLLPGESQ
jgi:translation initiation factor 3 subunit H